MRSRNLVWVITLIFIFSLALLSGCGPSSSGQETAGTGAQPDLQAELQQQIRDIQQGAGRLASMIHSAINDERARYGLAALQWDSDLATIALGHSKDMGERNYFDHVSPDGKDFKARYDEYGYHRETRIGDKVYVGGENLFMTNVVETTTYDPDTGSVYEYKFNDLESLARAADEGWMQSEGHRENILTPFSREGIGVFVTSEGKVYVTENFS